MKRRRVLVEGPIGLMGLSISAAAPGKSAAASSTDLADQLAIKRLIYRYAMALDGLSHTSLAECFAANAVIQGMGIDLRGDIAGGLIGRHRTLRSPQQQFTLNIVLNHWYEVRGNAAFGNADWIESSVAGPKGKWLKTDTHVRYDDELVKQGGRWKFIKRQYRPLFVTESPVVDYDGLKAELSQP